MQYSLFAFLVGSIAVRARSFNAKEATDNHEETLVSVPNSCVGKDDSDDTIVKLADGQSFPLVRTKCRNEFMIVDMHHDASWEDYFVSMRQYHYNLMGPSKDDHVNWQEWMTVPQDEFLISPDCNSCDADFELNGKYKTQSAYYMTPVASGCTQLPIGRIGCDMDWHTYSCRVCETSVSRVPGYWLSYEVYNGLNDPDTTLHFMDEVDEENFAKYGLCGFTVRDAKAEHSAEIDTFEHCKTVTHEDVEGEAIMPRRKPSMGQDGRFCMCVKPQEYAEFQVAKEQWREKANTQTEGGEQQQQQLASDTDDDNVAEYRLYQKDFEKGTYRIQKPGKYIVMEDITFDFKAPDGYMDGGLDTYNGPSDWWPTYDQIEDYPGAGDLRDPYFLGFWAGITIEADNVILELNHHSLQMSEALFYQQSFFALISLTSQVFLPGQGPGFFGASPIAASNVMIRNGVLGLTSHHGVQGNFNQNVLLENLKIYDFKTHGIQLSGFDGVTIKNVDVGPNRKLDMLTPYYAHMKALLPTYRMMVENEAAARDECIRFRSDGRDDECYYMQDMIDTVQTLLDMAFEYVVVGVNYDEVDVGRYQTDPELKRKMDLWTKYRSVLVNDHHSTQTATLYGIFLNYVGSNVIGWYAGSENTKSHNVVMENVKIHDLHHDTFENIAFSQGDATAAQRILNCLNAPFNAYHIFGEDQVSTISECNNYFDENGISPHCEKFRQEGLTYVGNPISDIQIMAFELLNKFDLSWNYCSAGAADMGSLAKFAVHGTQFLEFTPLLVASHDPMIHPGKGVMGLRLNGVDNVAIKDLHIDNIHSSTDIGTTMCGSYEQIVSQQAPYMNGFSMNMVKGASFTFATNVQLFNVAISRIISNTGLAYGLSAWYQTSINIVGKKGLEITHVHAGKELAPSAMYRRDSFPNLKPEACAFRLYDDVIYSASVQYDEDAGGEPNLKISCIHGHTGCLMENGEWTNVGEVSECEDSDSSRRPSGRLNTASMSNWYNMHSSKALNFMIGLVVALTLILLFCHKCMPKNYAKIEQTESQPLLSSKISYIHH